MKLPSIALALFLSVAAAIALMSSAMPPLTDAERTAALALRCGNDQGMDVMSGKDADRHAGTGPCLEHLNGGLEPGE